MTKKEAEQLIKEVKNWFPENSPGRHIMSLFKVDEHGNEVFARPISFSELAKWQWSKKPENIANQIRAIQKYMDTEQCPFKASIYLTHKKGTCFLVLGTEQTSLIRKQKEKGKLQNVTLSFEGHTGSPEELPKFQQGDLVNITASSPIKGWLHIFCVEADRSTSPVYPGEGKASAIFLSQNASCNISDKINKEFSKITGPKPPKPLHFLGESKGPEQFVVLVVDSPTSIPVTIAHLKSRVPLPFMFSHEKHREKGVGWCPVTSENDFSSLPLDKLAIGTLDYYYTP